MNEVPEPDRTPCPPWCQGEQCREVEPEDRFHQGSVFIPVIYRHVEERPDGSLVISPETEELSIVKFTSAVPGATDEVWVSLDLEPWGHVTVTEESMRRVSKKLGKVPND